MASFTNYATLTYSGGSTNSNTVTGEIVEVLTAAKTAVSAGYERDGVVTYALSLVNSGTAALTGLTVADNLGGYTFGTSTVYPLAYRAGTLRYYVNGVLQTTPTVTAGPPLVITGVSVPAGGSAVLIYEADVTAYAPLGAEDTITNTATVTGTGLTSVIATETLATLARPELTIRKDLSPTTVMESGQITYTFTIENTGNTAVTAADNAVITDTFDPILSNLTVTYNGAAWSEGVNYTYNAATGLFTTLAGQITVPAATYTQNTDGTYTLTPGTAVLTVTGTI